MESFGFVYPTEAKLAYIKPGEQKYKYKLKYICFPYTVEFLMEDGSNRVIGVRTDLALKIALKNGFKFQKENLNQLPNSIIIVHKIYLKVSVLENKLCIFMKCQVGRGSVYFSGWDFQEALLHAIGLQGQPCLTYLSSPGSCRLSRIFSSCICAVTMKRACIWVMRF